MPRRKKNEVLQGTLDLLILKTLAVEPLHGWGIAKAINARSDDILTVNQGSLYPALYRLLDRGLVEAEVGESDQGRPVKVYTLTKKGRKQLGAELEQWADLSRGVNLVLGEG